jgi:uncharacterized repeat protein (TIGR03803 family)
MTRINWHMAAAAAVLVMASPAGSLPAAAQAVGTETTVYTFTGATDGQNPADLVPYTDGNFYGTSDNTVFKVTPGGVFTTLHTFCPACGTSPPVPSGLVVGTDGNFYGLTGAADSMGATFYKITPGGAYTALNSSVTGNPAESVYASDSSQLILGTDGNFYGANSNGGASGSIFKIAPDGTFTTLYSFTAAATNGTNADGKSPQGKLIQGADGNFYGTTSEGGAYASGTVFQLTPAGVLTSLYSFGAVGGAAGTAGQNMDGLYPVAGLVQGTDGDFYGGTTNGGLHGIGTLFKVTAAGAYTVLHQFSNATTVSLTLSVNPTTISLGQTAALTWTSTGDPVPEGGGPLHSLVLGQDGNFYGFGGEVASASDTVFQMSPNGTFTTIVPASASSPNGGDPNSLFQIGNGTFYGSTRYGNDEGTANPYGTVFSMTLGTGSASQPCTASTSPTSNGGTWSGAEVANGSVIVTPTATGTYVYSLSCTYPQPSGTVGPAYAQLTVTGAAAPTVSITANPTSVSVGQSSTLTWSSTNASSCSASGAWSGSESLSGSFVVTPAVAGAQTYTLVCSGAGGNATASATVTATAAVAPTPTVTISASPTSITLGQNSTLTWTSTNATSCSASGAWTGAQAVSGSQAVTPIATGTSTYTLNCTGAGGSAQASAAVTVNTAPAPAVTVSVSTTSITLGASVLVTWSSTNATSCTASGAWTGTQATAGSIEETPTAVGTATYTLACSGSGSTSATANAVVTVQSAVAPGDTNLSGRAGGGGLGWSSLLGLAMLAVLRSRRAIRAACLAGMAACGFILPAAAQTSSPQLQFNWDNSYVGLRLGSGDYRESSSELDARIGAAGYSGTDTSITHHRLGGGVFAGVPFYGPLSLELGSADLGRYPIGITTTSTDIAGLSQTTARKLWPAGQAITLGFAAPLDVASWLAVEPRVAGLAFRSKQEVFTPLGTFSDDRSGGGLDAGLSLLIHASRTVSFGAGFDCFDLGGHCTVLMYSAEFSYHFGH